MRADQYSRLVDLQEQLTDVFLDEADSEEWPGAGTPISQMTKEDRGDRFWCKRNAAATMTLVMKIGCVIDAERRHARDNPDPLANMPEDPEDDREQQRIENAQFAEYERLAAAALARAKERKQA